MNDSRCVDVYLCDNCDKDFDSLQDLITHEKGCGKKEVPISPHILLSNNGLSLHMISTTRRWFAWKQG